MTRFAERIYQYSEVNSVYLMSGAFDFTVIIEGKTMREVAQFVSEKLSPMDSVLSTATILYSRNIRTTARSCMRSRGMKG